jgi:hypothetical protein
MIYPNYIRGWFRERNSFCDFLGGGRKRKRIEKTHKERKKEKRRTKRKKRG